MEATLRILNRLIAILTLAVVLLFGVLMALNWQSVQRIGQHVETFVGQALTLTLYCMSGSALLVSAAVGAWLYLLLSQRANENRRSRDGKFALQTVRVRGATVIVDPNRMLAPAMVVSPHGIAEIFTDDPAAYRQQALALSRVSVAQALTPGDNAIRNIAQHGGNIRWPHFRTTDRQLGDGKERPLLPAVEPQPQANAPAPVRRLYLREVLERATPNQLLVGQDDATGDLAIFDPEQSVHAGIVGATGTGKTTSAGFTLAAQALRVGFHVVILDPKGGADWSAWRQHAEWHPSNPEVFPAQVDALWREHARRIAAGGQHQPVLVVIEEYGDLIAQLRRIDRKRADATDATLDRLMRLSRSSRIHLLMIDQYPEDWSQQVIAGCKWLGVFRLGPNQGNKVSEYGADQLPDRGYFLLRRRKYGAWFAAPHLDRMLAMTPASSAPRVIDGEFTVSSSGWGRGATSGELSTNGAMNAAMNGATNTPSTTAEWYEWTRTQYLPEHPELLQVDASGRGIGVSALARAMARQARGDSSQMEAYKGVASEVARRLRAEVPPVGEETG
jgi:hypothetical protein